MQSSSCFVLLLCSFVSTAAAIYLTEHPAGNALAVGTQDGLIKLLVRPKSRSGTKATNYSTFLDLTDRVQFSGEQGLLSFAFHPSFLTNGRFFVSYICDSTVHPDCAVSTLGIPYRPSLPLLDACSETNLGFMSVTSLVVEASWFRQRTYGKKSVEMIVQQQQWYSTNSTATTIVWQQEHGRMDAGAFACFLQAPCACTAARGCTGAPARCPYSAVVAEYSAGPDPTNAVSLNTTEVRKVIVFGRPSASNNGGHIFFGSDGLLYVSSGMPSLFFCFLRKEGTGIKQQ